MMHSIYHKQIKKIEKQEQKLLKPVSNGIISKKLAPLTAKIETKIPPKLKETLQQAFFQGFHLVFSKGDRILEKTYNKRKIQAHYDVNNYTIEKLGPKKHLKQIDKQSKQSRRVNTSISIIEGAGLGLLGLGLPDIPLFIGMLLKTIYEIALSYGFDYESEEEKIYILTLISGALLRGEQQQKYDGELEEIAAYINWELPLKRELEGVMKTTSNHLSEVMLLGKYIQGLPIVGVYGGVLNFKLMNQISRYARLKYKKRYIQNKC
ncbi:MAG: EcsC family protein [Oscillospiraceae bacterium]|nr:EcsC family protein [Oscillospiraceae bacterium]